MGTSYPKVWSADKILNVPDEFFDRPIWIQEKIDGSQFSFGKKNGRLWCRSKRIELSINQPEEMFRKAVESIREREGAIREGFTYRGEYLQKQKHNTLEYMIVPPGNIVLYDVEDSFGKRDFQIDLYADELDLLYTRPLWTGNPRTREDVLALGDKLIQNTESMLVSKTPGINIEGVVIKSLPGYELVDKTFGRMVVAKVVHPSFREVNDKNWKNMKQGDSPESIGMRFVTPALFEKAVQHLRDDGRLTGTMADIPALMNEVRADIQVEYHKEILAALEKKYMKPILNAAAKRIVEWYRARLEEANEVKSE